VNSALVLLVIAALAVVVGVVVWVRRDSLVPKRGMGFAADMGAMAAATRVSVRAVTRTTPERVTVVLAPDDSTDELTYVVSLAEDDFGFGVLESWQRDGSVIAFVIPRDSHLLRLRSVESLQSLTLRRVDS
jgi:hypothetical protein